RGPKQEESLRSINLGAKEMKSLTVTNRPTIDIIQEKRKGLHQGANLPLKNSVASGQINHKEKNPATTSFVQEKRKDTEPITKRLIKNSGVNGLISLDQRITLPVLKEGTFRNPAAKVFTVAR